jgi:hypothetical protein
MRQLGHVPDPAEMRPSKGATPSVPGAHYGKVRPEMMLWSFIAVETYSDGRIISRSAIPKAHMSAMAM